MNETFLDFIYQAFLKICDTASKLYDFLFTEINLGNDFGTFYVWQLLTGAVLVTAIGYLIFRKFTI